MGLQLHEPVSVISLSLSHLCLSIHPSIHPSCIMLLIFYPYPSIHHVLSVTYLSIHPSIKSIYYLSIHLFIIYISIILEQ